MDAMPGAISLARALLTLQRSGRHGVLEVRSGTQLCRIALRDGTPVAATAIRGQSTLGDALMSSGDLDSVRHLRALEQSPPTGPVGAWLVDTGAASRPAVELALRNQLRLRILAVFRFRGLEYHFTEGPTDLGIPPVNEPMETCDLVLDALRAALAPVSEEVLEGSIGEGFLRLSPLGLTLLERAALWPAEAAMVTLLKRGVRVQRLRRALGDCPRALRTLVALRMLCAVEGRRGGDSTYALLARKRREVKHLRAPNVLLDLPADAGAVDARRALRRLARRLHPDRLDPDAPAAVRRASNEVMGALIQAESALRGVVPQEQRRASTTV